MRKTILLLLLAFILFGVNAVEKTNLYGLRVYDLSKPSIFDLVRFNSENPATVEVIKSNPIELASSAVSGGYANGYLYVYARQGTSTNKFAKISVEDWSVVESLPANFTTTIPYDMAYDSKNNVMYLLTINLSTFKSDLNTVNLSTGEYTFVKPLDNSFGTITFDSDGKLYGITQDLLSSKTEAKLCSIDMETGVSQDISPSLGVIPGFNQSMTFDKTSGKIYWAAHGKSHSSGDLLEIDPATGAFSNLGAIAGNANIVGLFTTLLPDTFLPAKGAEDVDLSSVPAVTFNSNMTAADLSLVSISPAVENVSASINDNVLTIAHDDFEYLTEYTITIPKEAIKDLAYDVKWTFKTVAFSGGCNPPSHLNAENVESDRALLSWVENGIASSWNIKYGETGFDVETEGTLIAEINELSYLLTGLNDMTRYDFYVQSVCDASTLSDWSAVYIFTTLADCNKGYSSFPWHEGFEDDVFPAECWGNYDIDKTPDGYSWERIVDTDFEYEGRACVSHNFHLNKSQEGWLVTRKFSIPEGDDAYILRFWNLNSNPDMYVYNGVWISEGSSNPEDGDFVEVWTPKVVKNEWREEVVNLSEKYAGKEIYIAFKYESTGAPNGLISQRWFIDDLSIDVYDNTDIQFFSFDEPARGGAGLPADKKVKVTLYNNGSLPLVNLPITLKVNDETVAQETIKETISSLTYYQYTFSTGIDLSALGTYKLEVEVALDGDIEPDNNVIRKTVVCVPGEHITLYGYSVMRYPSSDSTFISFSTEDLWILNDLAMYKDGVNVGAAGEYLNENFYMFTQSPDRSSKHFVKLDARTWTEIDSKNVDICATEMTYDYSTFTMYAIADQGLYTVDLTTGELSLVANLDVTVLGFACDMDGTLYGALSGGDFCIIDKETGDVDIIGNTSHVSVKYVQSMAFDHNTGRLFWAMVGDGPNSGLEYGGLAEIDKTTGNTHHHGKIHINGEIVGLHTPYKHPFSNIAKIENDKFIIYPNPTNGVINLNVSDNSVISIQDLTGKTMNTYNVNSGTSALNLDLPVGIYLIRLESDGKIYTNKLIVNE